MKKSFTTPTQVIFSDEESGRAIGGIAYGKYVISGDTGKLISITEIESIYELPWVSLSDEIIGE
jgi:hypothetical protein